MACISSLPGESESSQREVSTPYTTAAPAQASAMITPQSVRKSKGYVLQVESAGGHARGAGDGDLGKPPTPPGKERPQFIGRWRFATPWRTRPRVEGRSGAPRGTAALAAAPAPR